MAKQKPLFPDEPADPALATLTIRGSAPSLNLGQKQFNRLIAEIGHADAARLEILLERWLRILGAKVGKDTEISTPGTKASPCARATP